MIAARTLVYQLRLEKIKLAAENKKLKGQMAQRRGEAAEARQVATEAETQLHIMMGVAKRLRLERDELRLELEKATIGGEVEPGAADVECVSGSGLVILSALVDAGTPLSGARAFGGPAGGRGSYALGRLHAAGLIERVGADRWAVTTAGREALVVARGAE